MALPSGVRLGPYEVVELLGAGGMGEVYRARDTRLGRDVALKVLHEDVSRDPDRLRRFELEARAVAALNHPHILTVHDVGTHEGSPYVVTELLEGESLREVLSRRSPTQRQVLAWAVQAAQGLAAAHQKGIVHRDLKPENLFLTTDGRIKILDFGLAKQTASCIDSEEVTASHPTKPGAVMGTVAYMSPEQAQARPVDARSDLFSFGVVLYELLARRHPFLRETVAATLGAILQETPAPLVSLDAAIPRAVDGIVRRCLEKRREDRFQGAHDLGLALEAVLQAPTGAAVLEEIEERSPYPGLMSFTEKDAAVFFGREAEVKALWERIRARRLLAVIGPSGVGKTSFLRAGVVPSRPEGWATACVTPGSNPALGLARVLTPELAGDADAIGELLSGLEELRQTGETRRVVSAVKGWRARHAEALLLVDQFEELFTLNPPETQTRFAALLERLASEADVHVVLSMRDDFLIRCSDHEALAPVFSEITPLTALTREGLRRAVVEPAKKRGYRFEDEALVDEMVSAVEGVRGALPLVAFAVARLWEKRDRQRKLLTREAYQEIAGVEGALAQHAEAAMDKIGPERQATAREIFRNLVTAQGTRAVIDREELLSAFADRPVAEEVLCQLIDARLVTSYEVEGAEGQPGHHRVEVVHESLLRAWPRLVRWQAQDEEGAVLRDQLKQAAHLWEEKGRTSDLLWTGTAYHEYVLWRGRYAGALTALEEDFARAMAERAQRHRRHRRLAAGAVLAVAVVVAAVTGGLWRRSEAARRRAEAGKLLALARAELDRYPTAALAYTRASLELTDTPEARRFAVEVLWRAPVARILPVAKEYGGAGVGYFGDITFSSDGQWLATRSVDWLILLYRREGGPPRRLPRPAGAVVSLLGFSPRSDLLIAPGNGETVQLWSLPDLREVGSAQLTGLSSAGVVRGNRILAFTKISRGDRSWLIRELRLPGGQATALGALDSLPWDIDGAGARLAFSRGRSVSLRPLADLRARAERILGSTSDDPMGVAFFPRGDRLVSVDRAGEIRVWSLAEGARAPLRILQGPGAAGESFIVPFDGAASYVAKPTTESSTYLWNLGDPPDTEPALLQRPDPLYGFSGAFEPRGEWLVTGNSFSMAFWPLAAPRTRVLGRRRSNWAMAFTPDNRWLATCVIDEPARLVPLDPAGGAVRTLTPAEPCWYVAAHPAGTQVLVGTTSGKVLLWPTTGGPPRRLLERWESLAGTYPVAFDVQGRRAIASPSNFGRALGDPQQRILRVWDLESGAERVLSVAHLTDASWIGYETVQFAPHGDLFVAGRGISRLVLPADPAARVSAETLYAAGRARFNLSRDGRYLLAWGNQDGGADHFNELLVFDLAAGTSRRITTHGDRLFEGVFDATGRVIVTADIDGVVRAGPVTGEEPHLLLGYTGMVTAVAVSPDGRWIAAAGDRPIRLWPMPDVTKPPLHTLLHSELMAKLEALTNLRVVRDPTSSTGWKLDVGPFPGWKDAPTW